MTYLGHMTIWKYVHLVAPAIMMACRHVVVIVVHSGKVSQEPVIGFEGPPYTAMVAIDAFSHMKSQVI